MQVRLLGPVDVVVAGEPRPVSGLRRKAVLAALALHRGEVVSTGRLVDLVWGESAPPSAGTTLQNHVSYLRRVLDSKTAIRARPPGYILELGEDGTDVQLAERLLRQGRESADPVRAARYLQAALDLWRGLPLADLAGLSWLEEQAAHLDLLCLQVKRAWFEARLAAGEHAALVPDLEKLVVGRPLDEQLQAQLMLAQYRSGQQADALVSYHRLRRALDEELGIYPSQALRHLEAAILRQDPALDAPAPAAALTLTAPGLPGGPAPAQLPAAVPVFAGRGAELASLYALLPASAEGGPARPAAVVISALLGTAGVGKTTLAVHWAHRVSARFPDGQLYVNLQGFDPGGAALEASEALRAFLEAFGMPAARIPADLPARAGLYRSLLAGQRVLVVLDNARDVEQVRPLLPGSPGCLAIVTSRNHLTSLVASEGAYPVILDLLSAAASLAAISPGAAREQLSELTRAHLLAEHLPGRYAFHDLLRAYATEQAHSGEHQDTRDAAVQRVLDHYLHPAHSAAMLMEPHLDPLPLTPPVAGSFWTRPPPSRRRCPGSRPSMPRSSRPSTWLPAPATGPTRGSSRGR
jgi:DNA-binding SARP family transcriptional activator